MPLARLVFPFAAGVVLYLLLHIRLPVYLFLSFYVLAGLAWVAFRRFFLARYPRRWVFGAMASVGLLVAGYHLAHEHDQQYLRNHFSKQKTREGYLLLRITEAPSEKTNSIQVIGQVLYVMVPDSTAQATPASDNSEWPARESAQGQQQQGHNTHSTAAGHNGREDGDTTNHRQANSFSVMAVRGKLMLYLEKDSLAGTLRYGDMLLVENGHEEIRPPRNPKQFNYRQFLARQNIFHSSYRRSEQWQYTGMNKGHWLKRWSLQLRQHALTVFELHQLSGREFAVLSALLLGYREYLDENLQREFAGAGAMHILCVSGLHVGIIYLVLKTLTAFLRKFRGGVFLQTSLLLTLIWLYASVTGFSPSVLRASTMFSFVAVGQSLRRRTNIYNTLAASAFVLLAVDPFIISRIGFQLSYLAVISIVTLQPWMDKKIRFQYKVPARAWGIVTVSIAAQLATGPLSLYYFHQFPNYFILTNLMVIPLSGIIIYSSLLTLLLSPLPALSAWPATLLESLLYLLHASVRLVEGLPHAASTNVYISTTDTFLLFAVITAGSAYLLRKNRTALLVAMAGLLLLTTSLALRSISREQQKHFAIYSVPRTTVIDFFDGKQLYTLTCSTVAEDPGRASFHIDQYRISRGANHPDLTLTTCQTTISRLTGSGDDDFPTPNMTRPDKEVASEQTRKHGHWIIFGTKTLLVVSGNHNTVPADAQDTEAHFNIDYLIVCQNPRVDPSSYLEIFRPQSVIVDSSNSRWTTRRWQEACDAANVAFWAVGEKGAYLGRQ